MKPGGSTKRSKNIAPKSSLNSYYRGAAAPPPSPFEKKRPVKNWRGRLVKLTDVSLLIIILLCLLYSLIVRPDPNVVISSDIYQPASTYDLAATKAMSSLKDHTKLTFDEAGVISAMQRQFPEITDANVELPLFGQRPVLRLRIAVPQFIFNSQAKSFVLASNGLIIETAVQKPSFKNLPTIIDQSGFTAEPGKAVLSEQQVTFINNVVTQLKNARVPLLSFTLPAKAQEIDLRTKDKPYYVKFYLGGDALVQAGQLLAARHQFSINHKDPGQYLDVRIAGKIFYK